MFETNLDEISLLVQKEKKISADFHAEISRGGAICGGVAVESDESHSHLRSRKCATPGHDHRLGEHDHDHEEEPRGTVPTIRQSRGAWAE